MRVVPPVASNVVAVAAVVDCDSSGEQLDAVVAVPSGHRYSSMVCGDGAHVDNIDRCFVIVFVAAKWNVRK